MAKHWIQGAIGKPGALHRDLGVPQGQPIPETKLEAATHAQNPTIRRRANLAQTLKGMHGPKSPSPAPRGIRGTSAFKGLMNTLKARAPKV